VRRHPVDFDLESAVQARALMLRADRIRVERMREHFHYQLRELHREYWRRTRKKTPANDRG
jgi:hypothetical protein